MSHILHNYEAFQFDKADANFELGWEDQQAGYSSRFHFISPPLDSQYFYRIPLENTAKQKQDHLHLSKADMPTA